MPAGRPTSYTQELGDQICEAISRKTALAKWCDADESRPAPRTVYRWLREHEEFCQNYARAKEDQADFLAEETLEISDDDGIDPADKRIRVDTRKWLASKFKPKKYGERQQIEQTTVHKFDELTTQEIIDELEQLKND